MEEPDLITAYVAEETEAHSVAQDCEGHQSECSDSLADDWQQFSVLGSQTPGSSKTLSEDLQFENYSRNNTKTSFAFSTMLIFAPMVGKIAGKLSMSPDNGTKLCQ